MFIFYRSVACVHAGPESHMYLVRIAFEESRDYMHELYMYTILL